MSDQSGRGSSDHHTQGWWIFLALAFLAIGVGWWASWVLREAIDEPDSIFADRSLGLWAIASVALSAGTLSLATCAAWARSQGRLPSMTPALACVALLFLASFTTLLSSLRVLAS